MPLKKKKKTNFRIILTWTLIAVLILLMLISFPATQHMTEIVVYP
ncbi:MAG: hypothetical protein R8M71_04300 [Alphaproteobacteria bacterium]|jgi:uncharacterized membrane protein YozB (DUF420 family)|nr:hypothetical protein [Alphaproteobacteria bacterium]